MKTLLLIFYSIFIATFLAAQTKVGLKMMAFPNVSTPVYQSDGTTPDGVVESIKKREIGSFSFTTGAAAKFTFSEKWGISLGFNFMRTGYETKEAALTWGSSNPSLPTHGKFLYRVTNLEVPVLIERIFFQNENWNLYATTGPSWWYNLNNESTFVSKYDDGRVVRNTEEDTTTLFRQTNIAVLFGVGVARQVVDGIRIFTQPTAQFTLLGLSEQAPLNRRLFGYGLMLGILIN